MKKQNRFRFITLFFVVILSLQLLFALVPQQAFASSDPASDLNRRKLFTFLEALKVLNMGSLNKASDLYYNGDYGQNGERFVVGLDRESYNGVERYDAVVKDGLSVLQPGVSDPTTWLLNALTGHSNFNGGNSLKIDGGKLNSLEKRVSDAIDKIGTPSDDLRRTRILPLANVCFTVKKNATNKDYTFSVPNVGYFTWKSDDAIRTYIDQDLHITKNNGTASSVNVALGDLQLGFKWSGDGGFTGGGFDRGDSNFYPVGDDFSQAAASRNGILDCNFVKNNADWLFKGASLDANGNLVAPGGKTVASSNPDSGSGPDQATCISSAGSLSWIICPIINAVADGADAIFQSVVVPLLQASPVKVDSGEPLYQVWASFRNIANVLLVVFLLIAVYSQAIGGGLIDAYTAKKIIPRVVAAAILINLSIYICAGAVDITNIIGKGIGQLILIPFSQTGNLNFSLSGLGAFGTAAAVGGGVWALVAGGGPLLAFILLFVLLPLALAIIGVFVTLFIRYALITFLIMVSPIAFALYCLPNTEQYLRKWWDLFFKTLLVFPIVMALYAMANVAPAIFDKSQIGGELLTNIMQIVALVLPLFLIPFAFKFAGGMVGNIYGSLAGLSKRGSEAFKGDARDANSLQSRVRSKFRIRKAEKGMTGAALMTRANPLGDRKSRISALRNAQIREFGGDATQNPFFQQYKDDDKVMKMLALHKNGQAAKDWVNSQNYSDEDKSQWMASIAAAERIGYNSSTRRAAMMSTANIGYGLEEGEEGWNKATAAMADISGGDQFALRSMINEFQYVAKSAAGRADLAGNVDSMDYNGYRAWSSVGLYQHGNSKPADINGAGKYFAGLTQRARSNTLTSVDLKNFKEEATRRQVSPQIVALEAAAVFSKEQDQLAQNATGAVRDAALRQQAVVNAELDQVNPAAVQLVDPGTPTTTEDGRPISVSAQYANSNTVNKKARVYDRFNRGDGPGAPPAK